MRTKEWATLMMWLVPVVGFITFWSAVVNIVDFMVAATTTAEAFGYVIAALMDLVVVALSIAAFMVIKRERRHL